jgi:hypothetical protein
LVFREAVLLQGLPTQWTGCYIFSDTCHAQFCCQVAMLSLLGVNDVLDHATAVEIDGTEQQHDGKRTDETTTVRFGRANNATSDE